LHLCKHLALDFTGISLQYFPCFVDVGKILFPALKSATWALAILDMVFKAKFVFAVSDAFSGNALSASAQGVEVLDEFQQCLQGGDVAVWAKESA
jgi:hypothetical protein